MSSSDPSPLQPAARREEQVLVLFASQTGNSEQAAVDIANAIPEKLSKPSLNVTSRHMQLDDFLELHEAQWTRLVVIVCSSYGVGQAPLGGYRFRALCDALLERAATPKKDTNHNGCSSTPLFLDGLSFALLGLGDSKYTTFFQNPTITKDALEVAGAKCICEVGKADASSADQLGAIEQWIDGILWSSLQNVLGEYEQQELTPSQERLNEMQNSTIDLCRELDAEFMPIASERTSLSLWTILPVLVAMLGVAWYYFDALAAVEEEQASEE